MFKKEVVFLEDRVLSSQSEQFKKLSKVLIRWKKAGPSNKPTVFFFFGNVGRKRIL